MFTTPHIPMRFESITPHSPLKKDEKEIPLMEVTCELNPLTPALAGEIHDFVKRTLFTSTVAEANRMLKGASFELSVVSQKITVRMAPDQGKPSFEVPEAKITAVKAKRSAKSSAWTLVVTFLWSPPSDKVLGALMDCYLKQRYLTWENAGADLFTIVEEPKATRGRGMTGGAGESATAH